jgi:uncharacterized RDD family membrane protein YckC
MEWFYVENGNKVGPVSETDFEGLVRDGKITDDTLVWREGMQNWLPHGQAASAAVAAGAAPPAAQERCAECGNTFSTNDMIHHGESWICAACKPTFLQRLKEGASLPGTFDYGGFWIRAGAKLIDWIVLWPISFVFSLVGTGLAAVSGTDVAMMAAQVVVMFLNMAIPVLYTTWMLGKWGATLGKMACGLKVVMPDGGKVSYGRACGRYFAEILSGMILCIGYIMAAGDDERRTLHDRICDTRVIRK